MQLNSKKCLDVLAMTKNQRTFSYLTDLIDEKITKAKRYESIYKEEKEEEYIYTYKKRKHKIIQN